MLNSVRFDWFSFTIKGKSLDDVMFDLGFKYEEFEMSSFARYGYKSMIVHEVFDICVLFDGTDSMGIHVAVSGGSIRYFMECFSNRNGMDTPFGKGFFVDMWHAFASYVLANGQFSRVDVNIDTDMPFLSPYNLRDLAVNGEMVSLYRSWKFYQGSDGSGTLYLGKRGGASFIRIYDKAKEQGDFESTLYRFEVQFNKSADDFMRNMLVHGLAGAFYAFINKQVRFVPCGDYFDMPYTEWSDFLKLICDSDDYDFFRYDSKKRKNTVKTLFHMFSQYHNIVDDFLENHGNMDDFIEYMLMVFGDIDGNKDDVINYCHEKGWDLD